MVTIYLVLRTGGEYDHRHVNNIVDGIKQNTTIPHRIICLTNDKRQLTTELDDIIRFNHDWPKWWGKIELFRPDLCSENSGQSFFFDLDTFIVDNIDDLLSYTGEFCALEDFYNPEKMGSGLMSWNGSRVVRIYSEFLVNPQRFMNNIAEGDQAFISLYKPSIEYFQHVFPRKVVSYKVHCYDKYSQKASLPPDARVVCFHGKPRPHDLNNSFRKFWNQ